MFLIHLTVLFAIFDGVLTLSLTPRVREAAMTSLMQVTLLVAGTAPEILPPDL